MSSQGTTTTTTINNSSNSMGSAFTTMGPMGSPLEEAVDSLRHPEEVVVDGVEEEVGAVVAKEDLLGAEDGVAAAVMARLRM